MALPLRGIRARGGGTHKGGSGLASHLCPLPTLVFLTLSGHRAQVGGGEIAVAAAQSYYHLKLIPAQGTVPAPPGVEHTVNLVEIDGQTVDSGLAIYTVYFDFTKAFDRVDYDLLLLKLPSFGIGNKLLNLIFSYLNARAQRFKMSDVSSNPTHVRSGVILGSVLGPLLFSFFVNDVPDCFQYGRPFMYADDLKVAYRYKPVDRNIVLELLKKDLQAFAPWCFTWRLSLSWHKCSVMVIGDNHQTHLSIDGHDIKDIFPIFWVLTLWKLSSVLMAFTDSESCARLHAEGNIAGSGFFLSRQRTVVHRHTCWCRIPDP
ncbi:unnamed protein product [Schistocephalus solidus]|uniref:Reverse transcriptase domain-containing protein n=1 Tax=Schistocephalus solidus TaxID=70667 RepID=A0A183SX70_SCHSO|nr:unnamed protein product [Schistocephalus solidus]